MRPAQDWAPTGQQVAHQVRMHLLSSLGFCMEEGEKRLPRVVL